MYASLWWDVAVIEDTNKTLESLPFSTISSLQVYIPFDTPHWHI